MLTPGHYHADTSELIQMLQKGHQGVELDAEGLGPADHLDRSERPLPRHLGRRLSRSRFPARPTSDEGNCSQLYGGPTDDPERNPGPAAYDQTPVQPGQPAEPEPVAIEGWPFDAPPAGGVWRDGPCAISTWATA